MVVNCPLQRPSFLACGIRGKPWPLNNFYQIISASLGADGICGQLLTCRSWNCNSSRVWMKVMLINQQLKTPCLGFRKVALKRQLPEGDFLPKNLGCFFCCRDDPCINDRGNVWSLRLSGPLFVSFRFLLLKVNVDPFPHEKVPCI